jgi:hypothetical protein
MNYELELELRFYARGPNDPPGNGPVVVCATCGTPWFQGCEHGGRGRDK